MNTPYPTVALACCNASQANPAARVQRGSGRLSSTGLLACVGRVATGGRKAFTGREAN